MRNNGTVAAGASSLEFRLGDSKVGTAAVGTLAPGASANVSAAIGPRDAGSYELSAVADVADAVIEQNETNNTYTASSPLVVKPVASSDLVATLGTSPSAPAAGDTVNFSVSIKNQGTVASAGGSHGITLTVVNSEGATVKTLTGAHSGVIAAGATAPSVALGTWAAANGSYTVKVVLADDANEVPVKRENNTSSQSLFVGRGASMPFDMYEAEDGTTGGGATKVGPNRTIGDIAGEASGRRAVNLDATGEFVEFTTRASTNTLVTRFSIPDSAGGGGINSTLNVYVDGVFLKAIDLTSKYAWLYGAEAGPGNSPGQGAPRHIYDEANVMLGKTVPAGSKIKLQKDAANNTTYAIDFINLEQVAPVANPDPATYTVPAGFTHQDVQNALDRVRMDNTGTLKGVYLPAGDYQTASKFQVYGKPVQVIGNKPLVHQVPRPLDAGQHRHRLPGRGRRRGFVVQELRVLRQLHLAYRRSGQGVRLLERAEHRDRQHLERAHGVPLLGREHRRHDHQELPDPEHVRRRHQHDQRQHRQPRGQQRGTGHGRRQLRAVLGDRQPAART